MNKLSDNWCTPQALFDELNEEFNFDIDLCATAENSKCEFYCADYLDKDRTPCGKTKLISVQFSSWVWDKTAFVNPPYSNPKPFIDKAWEDSKHCKIVCLVKCDPSTRWWEVFWEYGVEMLDVKTHANGLKTYDGFSTKIYRGPKPGCEVRFFPKRIKFDPPQQLIDDGTYWKEGNKWYYMKSTKHESNVGVWYSPVKTAVTGCSFPSALVIMDRRGKK